MSTPNTGLSEQTTELITSVLKQYSAIERAILYGSRAKGNYHQGSDIDLTLMGEQLGEETLYKIDSDLDDLLLPYEMDLSLFSSIDNAELIDHIQRRGIIFYESKNFNHQTDTLE